MHVDEAIKTKQFWLPWLVLCLNVTAGNRRARAGVGDSGNVSRGDQRGGGGRVRLIAQPREHIAAVEFVPDVITPPHDVHGFSSYWALPRCTRSFQPPAGLRQRHVFRYVLRGDSLMYGGGFATILAACAAAVRRCARRRDSRTAARLAEVAGVAGPVLVSIREYQISTRWANAYSVTMYLMAALLLVGFVANFPRETGRRVTSLEGIQWLRKQKVALVDRRPSRRYGRQPAVVSKSAAVQVARTALNSIFGEV